MWNGYATPLHCDHLVNSHVRLGLIEKDLIAHCKRIQGVDISQGMVDKYNERAESLGVADKMRAVALELKADEGMFEGEKFDVVLVRVAFMTTEHFILTKFQCTMAYHHFESPLEITKLLKFFLKPGGVLIITDREGQAQGNDSEAFPPHMRLAVPHMNGFVQADMRKMFEDAGLEDVQYALIPGAIMEKKLFGIEGAIFMLKGKNPQAQL